MTWQIPEGYTNIIEVIVGIITITGVFIGAFIGIRNWLRKPKLKIEFNPEWVGKLVRYADVDIVRCFNCVFVKNKGKTTAKRCTAKLTVVNKPENAINLDETHILHWADIPYSLRTIEPEPVDIGSISGRLDVAFSQPRNPINERVVNQISQMSAGTSSTSAYPRGSNVTHVYPTGMIPDSFDSYYASGAVTPVTVAPISQIESPESGTDDGSWFAVPIALSRPDIASQAYMPVGEYLVKIEVECENGKGDIKWFKIISPPIWTALSMGEIESPER
jgi:hypothetical protein